MKIQSPFWIFELGNIFFIFFQAKISKKMFKYLHLGIYFFLFCMNLHLKYDLAQNKNCQDQNIVDVFDSWYSSANKKYKKNRSVFDIIIWVLFLLNLSSIFLKFEPLNNHRIIDFYKSSLSNTDSEKTFIFCTNIVKT
jgi:hypothetical protein